MNNLKSIRIRLTLRYMAIFSCILLSTEAFILLSFRNNSWEESKNKIRDKSFVVGAWITFENPDFDSQLDEYLNSQEDSIALQLYDLKGKRMAQSENFTTAINVPFQHFETVKRTDDAVLFEDQEALVVVNNLYNGSQKSGYVLLQKKNAHTFHSFRKLLRTTVLGTCIALLLASVAGWWLTGIFLKPINDIILKASEINAEKLESERIPVHNPEDEIGRLSLTINDLLKRLETSFRTQRQFVSDAAHELRTPLTILKGQLDVALLKKNYTEELILKVKTETDHLINLTNTLLLLARSDAGEIKNTHQSFDLSKLIGSVLVSLQDKAIQRSIRIETDEYFPVIKGDPDLWRSALYNLLDNAIKYNKDEGFIWIRYRNSWLEIEDAGIGISAEQIPFITQRFYRETSDRNKSIPGTGLGMALVKSILDLHRCSLRIESSVHRGTRILIDMKEVELVPGS